MKNDYNGVLETRRGFSKPMVFFCGGGGVQKLDYGYGLNTKGEFYVGG